MAALTETLLHGICINIHNLNIKENSLMCEISISTPTDAQITALNHCILNSCLVNHKHTYPVYSLYNTVCNPDEVVNNPTDVLNSVIVLVCPLTN